MKQKEPPRIEFPCANYPIKVVCRPFDGHQQHILDVVSNFAQDCTKKPIKLNQSSGGKFVSLTLYLTATSKEQLEQIHQALIAHQDILTVL